MSTETRPSEHAVLAHVEDGDTAEAAIAAMADRAGFDRGTVATGTGAAFAEQLEAGSGDAGPAGRVVKWLLSLGQEREELARLGQHAREGRHAIVVNEVTDRDRLDEIVAVLKQHDARDIRYIGEWETEDLSINR
jgi:hypothetical protein